MTDEEKKTAPPKQEMNYLAVLWYIHLHALGAYGLWLLCAEAKWMTVLFALVITSFAALGVTVGAHRLWAHQTFVASWQVRLFLVLAHTLAGVGPIYDWVFWHRVHHKYHGTDKDPYDRRRGLWYAHVYSNLVVRSETDREQLEKEIDMRDVTLDGYVWIQQKFYWVLFTIVGLLLPINAPAEYWDESLINSVFILGFLRLAVAVNVSWLVHSAILIWGLKPGDRFPVEDNSVFFVTKSYWPNYHYLLPWDWKNGEFGEYDRGCGTFVLKILHELGLIDCLRTASSDDVREALYRAATKKTPITEVLEDIKEVAFEEAVKTKLRYYH